ncbi:MAG: 3D domain-containing protein [Candidatus Scalindua sp.]
MKSQNNILTSSLAVAFLIMIFQAGCATTTVQETPLLSTEAMKATPSLSTIESGTGLTEITDPNQIPDFKDDYDKTTLLYALDNSRVYFEKIKSYPDSFKSIGFTPEKQIETLNLFRAGYVSSKSPQELSEFIAKNFRVFRAIGKENGGAVQFVGYGFAVFGDDVERKWKHTVHYGSIGLPVTPIRSIATGEGIFPPGGLAFAVMETGGQVEKSFFVLGHDTRSVIKTSARADIFFGIGKDALQEAENLNNNGKLYYLLKR